MIDYGFKKEFFDDFHKLEPFLQKWIREKIKYFVCLPNPFSQAVKLKGTDVFFRFRVGHYRILFRAEKSRIVFLGVKHRKDVYR